MPHQGGGFVRMEPMTPPNSWSEDINANCHGIFNLKTINCIPLSSFLTNPLKIDIDAATHTISNVGKIFIGSAVDDGSGALLQVRGEINADSYMIKGVEFAASSNGQINISNINNINGTPIANFSPAGIDGSVQFNDDGKFEGDNLFIYDDVTGSLRVGLLNSSNPQWKFEVGGDINIVDPNVPTFAYRINGVPFAVGDPSGYVVNLVNIGTINGQPIGGGGGGNPTNVVGGLCITVDNSVPGTAIVSANVPCIQTPWLQNIDAAAFNLNNLTSLTGTTGSYIYMAGNSIQLTAANAGAVFTFGSSFGVRNPSPAYPLDISGDTRTTGCYFIGPGTTNLVSLCNDGSGNLLINGSTISEVVGATPPAPPNEAIQWNNAGVFGGSANLVWNNTDQRLGIGIAVPNVPIELSSTVSNNTPMVRLGNPYGVMELGGDYNGFWIDSPSFALTFKTTHAEWMRITTTGLVGIATTTPAYRLDVNGPNNAYVARFTNAGTFCGVIIDHTDTPGGESILSFRSAGVESAVISYDSDEDALILWTGNRDAGLSTLCCDTNSNVGINTTSPAYKLDVTGDVNSIGCYRINGVAFACSDGATGINLSNITHINGAVPGGGSQWTDITGGGIYYNGGNVGIGTANPLGTLNVVGVGGLVISDTDSSQSQNALYTISRNAPTGYLRFWGGQTGFSGYLFDSQAGRIMTLANNGHVGIGIDAPSVPLSVFANNLLQTIKIATYEAPNNCYGIGVQNGELTFGAGIAPNAPAQMVLTNAGCLGIGITSPGTTLDVNGVAHIRGQVLVGANAAAVQTGDICVSRDVNPGTGCLYFGNSQGQYIYWDGTNFNFTSRIAGVGLTLSGDMTIFRGAAPTTGYIFYGNGGTAYLGYDGSSHVCSRPFVAQSDLQANGNFQVIGVTTLQGIVGAGGWGSNVSYGLSVPSIHCGSILADSGITVYGNVNITGYYQTNGVQYSATHVYGNNNNVGFWAILNFKSGASTTVNITGSPTVPGGLDIWYDYVSDRRIKRNIRDLEGGMSIIKQLRPISAEYNGLAGYKDGRKTASIVAQEVQEILPDAVLPSVSVKLNPDDEEETELLAIDTNHILFHAVLAIKQLDYRLRRLELQLG